ncbi:MAG: hypothetical protein ACR2H9_13695 [Longimicrobiaceae bacterium]
MAMKWWVGGILALCLLVAIIMVFREAFRGPTFRAEDHASFAECIAAIPREWGQGSMERSGAETACMYVHQELPR